MEISVLRRVKLLLVSSSVFALACGADRVTAADAPLVPGTVRDGLLVSTPADEGIDAIALDSLVTQAKAEHSDALVVLRSGKLVYESLFGGADDPIAVMSVSKSMVGVAVGFLIADGKLASIDEPVAKVLPNFAAVDSRKAAITYRHLLTQTSGLDPARAFGLGNDIEQRALVTRCLFAPGTSWQYSNNGIDILGLAVGKLAGVPLDQYLSQRLFQPLGISKFSWIHDVRGVPYGAGELSLRPIDLAKIGEVILDHGVWNGRTVIQRDWIKQSFTQSNSFEIDYGLLWWLPVNSPELVGVTSDLLVQWVGNGLSPAIATKLQALVGQTFFSVSAVGAAISAQLTADEFTQLGNLVTKGDHVQAARLVQAAPGSSFYGEGWLGQYLDIVPNRALVAVRMRRALASDYADQSVELNAFGTFLPAALRLVPSAASPLAPQ